MPSGPSEMPPFWEKDGLKLNQDAVGKEFFGDMASFSEAQASKGRHSCVLDCQLA